MASASPRSSPACVRRPRVILAPRCRSPRSRAPSSASSWRSSDARRCLEIGTFTGYSSLAVALALPDDGTIVCCDVSEEYTGIARRYWAEAGVAHKTDLRIGPAVDTLDALLADGAAGTFDLAFIDADKRGYPDYWERCVALVRPGGVIAVDNVLWSGDVADPSNQDRDTVVLRQVNETIDADERVTPVMLAIADGMTLARRR